MSDKSKKPKRGKFVPKVKKRHAVAIMADEPNAWCVKNKG